MDVVKRPRSFEWHSEVRKQKKREINKKDAKERERETERQRER